jgi:hypothetical protein
MAAFEVVHLTWCLRDVSNGRVARLPVGMSALTRLRRLGLSGNQLCRERPPAVLPGEGGDVPPGPPLASLLPLAGCLTSLDLSRNGHHDNRIPEVCAWLLPHFSIDVPVATLPAVHSSRWSSCGGCKWDTAISLSAVRLFPRFINPLPTTLAQSLWCLPLQGSFACLLFALLDSTLPC